MNIEMCKMCKHWRVAVIKRRVYRTGSASDIIITNQKLCSTYSELALKVYQFLVMLDISRANFFWLKKFARHMSSKFVKWLKVNYIHLIILLESFCRYL